MSSVLRRDWITKKNVCILFEFFMQIYTSAQTNDKIYGD